MSEREKSDLKRIAPISLIYGCIDEFSSALHLARHHYYFQANTHLRTVLETLDKISLFIKFPENIDIFLGDDQEKARKKLSHANVRTKIRLKTTI
jgi:cob(I)alamin adenosyltransferase